MTHEQDLHILNNSMEALREIAALPEKDEFALLRAMAHTQAINEACKRLQVWADAGVEARAFIAKVAA
jgi:hypothetical protein